LRGCSVDLLLPGTLFDRNGPVIGKTRWILFLAPLVILILLTVFWQESAASLRGTVYEPPLPAADFSLIQADGKPFRLSEQRGKIVLLFFGYTSCPDVCPTTLAELSQAMKKLDEQERARVVVAFISVDPGRDTPERIQEYAQRFFPSFIGLSGTEAELQPIWSAYGVYREVQSTNSAAGYLIAHSARVYLIDPQGNLYLTFPFGTRGEDITHDLKILLRRQK
ncbi:MAG: SCO family protein, partial [Anaerolineales bacterium]